MHWVTCHVLDNESPILEAFLEVLGYSNPLPAAFEGLLDSREEACTFQYAISCMLKAASYLVKNLPWDLSSELSILSGGGI